MAQGYLPVDTPPGTKPLPLGTPVPAKAGGGMSSQRSPVAQKRNAVRRKGKRPPTKKRVSAKRSVSRGGR